MKKERGRNRRDDERSEAGTHLRSLEGALFMILLNAFYVMTNNKTAKKKQLWLLYLFKSLRCLSIKRNLLWGRPRWRLKRQRPESWVRLRRTLRSTAGSGQLGIPGYRRVAVRRLKWGCWTSRAYRVLAGRGRADRAKVSEGQQPRRPDDSKGPLKQQRRQQRLLRPEEVHRVLRERHRPLGHKANRRSRCRRLRRTFAGDWRSCPPRRGAPTRRPSVASILSWNQQGRHTRQHHLLFPLPNFYLWRLTKSVLANFDKPWKLPSSLESTSEKCQWRNKFGRETHKVIAKALAMSNRPNLSFFFPSPQLPRFPHPDLYISPGLCRTMMTARNAWDWDVPAKEEKRTNGRKGKREKTFHASALLDSHIFSLSFPSPSLLTYHVCLQKREAGPFWWMAGQLC